MKRSSSASTSTGGSAFLLCPGPALRTRACASQAMPNHAVLPAAPQADEVARVTAERDRLHANVQSVHEVREATLRSFGSVLRLLRRDAGATVGEPISCRQSTSCAVTAAYCRRRRRCHASRRSCSTRCTSSSCTAHRCATARAKRPHIGRHVLCQQCWGARGAYSDSLRRRTARSRFCGRRARCSSAKCRSVCRATR